MTVIMATQCNTVFLSLLLFGLCSAYSLEQPRVNRRTCQNAFTAFNDNKLDECARQWASAPWVEHSKDSTFYCNVCRTAASVSWDGKIPSVLCNMWSDPLECDRVFTALSRTIHRKDRDVVLCNVLTMCNSHGYIADLDFGSDLCSDCKKIIQDVKQLIADNATIEQITSSLNKYICDNLPGGIKDYCENMVKIHVPAFLNCFDAKIDPGTICSIVGLCRKTQTSIQLKDFMFGPKMNALKQSKCLNNCPKQTSFSWISRPSIPNNQKWTSKVNALVPSCDECEQVFTQVQTVLQDSTMQSEIKQIIDDKICANMGFLKHECQTLVNHNFDTVLAALLKLNPQEACAIFKMCPQPKPHAVSHLPLKPIIQSNIPIPGVCKVCEVIVRKLFDMIAANQTEESLYKGMKAMCNLFPPRYQTECTDFVNKYGVQIVKAVIEGTAPALICASFGLCTEAPVSVVLPVLKSTDLCTPCKFAVETIYLQLRNNKTEDEIRTALDQVCGLLPAHYTDQCKEYVNAYLDIVIQYMENNLTPEQVCQLLKLCPDSKSQSLSEQNPCLLGPDYWCSNYLTAKRCGATHYCQNYERRTYKFAGRNLSPLNNNEPKSLCKWMDLSTICTNFDLAKQCDRVQDCVRFKLKTYLDLVSEPFRFVENCSTCEQIVIRWRLQSRILGGAIVNATSCSTYTSTKKRQCELVHQHHGLILNAIRQGTDEPQEICARTIGCKPVSNSPATPKQADRQALYPEEFYDKSFQPLRAPQSSSELGDIVNEAVNYFESLDTVNHKTSPPPPVPVDLVRQTLLGQDPCTWGPSFWCLSYENARKCPKALEHCQTKVWTNGMPPADTETKPSKTTEPSLIHCCKSADAARHCGPEALKFCMQHVWSNTGKIRAN